MSEEEIYLDGAANTPMDPEVFKAMEPYMKNYKGNSHAIHSFGINAMLAIENSRERIASCLCDQPENIFFTSGATEGNNWVIQSLAMHELSTGMKRKKIICSALEHSSIINTCKFLSTLGFEIIYYYPGERGMLLASDLIGIFSKNKDVLLTCVMSVNNEIGTAFPVNDFAKIAHENGSLFLCDCTQQLTYGKSQVMIRAMYPEVDYLTFSSHKIYGPTGAGVLCKREGSPLYPFMFGGAQEQGLRGGTHNIEGIVGMAKAVELMSERDDSYFYSDLLTYLLKEMKLFNETYDQDVKLTIWPNRFNIVNLNVYNEKNPRLFTQIASDLSLEGIAVSAGSACDATTEEHPAPSHVLKAIGVPEEQIGCCFRISFTHYTTFSDIDELFEALKRILIEK